MVALADHLAYCTSKYGLLGLIQVLALEWGPRGVQVNAVSPTVVLTEMGKEAWAGEPGEAMKREIPLRRFAMPDEVAAATLFLASDGADMITGAHLIVDGGYTIVTGVEEYYEFMFHMFHGFQHECHSFLLAAKLFTVWG